MKSSRDVITCVFDYLLINPTLNSFTKVIIQTKLEKMFFRAKQGKIVFDDVIVQIVFSFLFLGNKLRLYVLSRLAILFKQKLFKSGLWKSSLTGKGAKNANLK